MTDQPFAIPYDEDEHGHLPVTRNSERGAFTRCRQAWWWGSVDMIGPKDEPLPLRFGDLAHQCLDRWYVPGGKRGEHPAETFAEVYEQADKQFNVRNMTTKDWVDAEALGIAMMNGYVDHYGQDHDWKVVSPEMSFQVVLLSKSGEPYIRVVGRVDAVVRSRSTKRLSLVEHKTASSIRTSHLTLDDQAGTYWTFAPIALRAAGVLGPDEELDQIIYNYLRKAMPDDRPQDAQGRYLNKDGSVSKKQPPAYFERHVVRRGEADRFNLVDRIRKQTWEMAQVREGNLPVYKATRYDCPNCKFHALCELDETGADAEEFIRLAFKTKHPYSDYGEAFRGSHDDDDD